MSATRRPVLARQDPTGAMRRRIDRVTALTARSGLRLLLRRFLVACLVVTVFAAAGIAVGDRYAKHEFAKRTTIRLADGVLASYAPAKPANFLLFGHDDTGNSDTMMVIHLDPVARAPLLVSFPRDLIVNVPGYGLRQLNSAYGLGGASLLVRTLEADFHFPIQHFLQVDFATFPQIVDAIGHVKVWFPTPVHDPYIGLDVEHAGCVSLDGPMALAYVRSRHYYVPDSSTTPAPWSWNYPAQQGGQGWSAVGSDIDRIPRQQYFLRTIAQTAISRTEDDPLRILSLVDAIVSHLTTDQNLTLGELKALVRTFRQVRPADIDTTTLPWGPDPTNPNRVIVKFPDANTVLDKLANFSPPAPFLPRLVNPHTVTVRVVNRSNIVGLATQALNSLIAAGFRPTGPAVEVNGIPEARTHIRWAPHKETQGLTAVLATGAKAFGQSPTSADTRGADVLIVVGRDWNALSHQPTNLRGPRRTPTPQPTGTTQAATTTTSTAVDRRFTPVDPKTSGVLVGCPSQ